MILDGKKEKGGKEAQRERKRERRGSERERDEESMRERERERRGEYENREGKEKSLKKQMCQNCMPTMNVNTL